MVVLCYREAENTDKFIRPNGPIKVGKYYRVKAIVSDKKRVGLQVDGYPTLNKITKEESAWDISHFRTLEYSDDFVIQSVAGICERVELDLEK